MIGLNNKLKLNLLCLDEKRNLKRIWSNKYTALINKYTAVIRKQLNSMRQAQMNSDIVNDMDAVAGLLNAEQATQKRIQDMLSGVLPPPSVTIIEYDCNNMMLMFKKHYVEMDNSMNCTDGTEVVNNSTAVMPAKLENVEWPQIRECNEFGLHYNRTKYSESIEMLYMRLAERNVGLETGSSFLSGISTNIRKKPPKKL